MAPNAGVVVPKADAVDVAPNAGVPVPNAGVPVPNAGVDVPNAGVVVAPKPGKEPACCSGWVLPNKPVEGCEVAVSPKPGVAGLKQKVFFTRSSKRS